MVEPGDPKSECALGKSGVCVKSKTVEAIQKSLKVPGKSPQQIMMEAMKKTGCKDQKCVLQNQFVITYLGEDNVQKELKFNFKPYSAAAGSRVFLTNFDIEAILQQIQNQYPKFYFLKIHMIDFATAGEGETLENIDFARIAHDYDCIGTIINTDRSTGRGIHWFAIFIDFRNPREITIEYFNSAGDRPMREIREWMINAQHRLTVLFPKREVKKIEVAEITYQQDNHSCGVWSIYYIYSRVSGFPYTRFSNEPIEGGLMTAFRDIFFTSSA